MTVGQQMLSTYNMVRVGVDEVYIEPDGTVRPAMMAVIWGVNTLCKAREIEPVFGEPKLSSDNYRTIEEYEHARVVHVKDKRDGTIRIVAKDELGRELLAETWDQIHERVLLARYAKQTFPETKSNQLEWYLKKPDESEW